MTELRLQVPRKLRPFLNSQHRHRIARGGRGSAKSWTVGQIKVAEAIIRPKRTLCLREVQKSIKESSHRLIADTIDRMGMSAFFDVQRDAIKGANGSEFAFAGLQDHTSDSIKSYEGFDDAWVEEAHTVTERSANILIPTIRKPGSSITWTYNPEADEDFVHLLANSGRDDVLVVDINWRDNPWFPAELETERRAMQALNPDLYRHIWEGECRSVGGILFKREWFKFYDVLPARLNKYLASDYAVTEDGGDWTEHGVWGLNDAGDLYAVDWWHGQTDPATWIDAWLELIGKHRPMAAFEEKGVILRAVEGSINKRMRETQTFVRRVPLASAGSKAERALGFAARASAGSVYLPRSPWGVRLLNQLCAFNGESGRQDDAVDVCSLIGRGLDEMANAGRPQAGPTTNRRRDYGFSDSEVSNWKTA